MPSSFTLGTNSSTWPNRYGMPSKKAIFQANFISLVTYSYTTAYAEAVSAFGRMIEVRVARNTQHLPIFVRMLDKVHVEDKRHKANFKSIQPKLTL